MIEEGPGRPHGAFCWCCLVGASTFSLCGFASAARLATCNSSFLLSFETRDLIECGNEKGMRLTRANVATICVARVQTTFQQSRQATTLSMAVPQLDLPPAVPKLVTYYADPQQCELSDECRMLFGRYDYIHPYMGDVPLLVEESSIVRTPIARDVLMPSEDRWGDLAIPDETPLLSGVTVDGTAFDAATDILITQANKEVQEATQHLGSAGVAVRQLNERRVWATDDEMYAYHLQKCPMVPNTVIRDGRLYFRTTLPWYCARLYHPFDVHTKQPFSPRVQVALRAWCVVSQTWWSVWGSAEGYAAAGIPLVDQPIDVHVVDEWGDTHVLISAYSCLNPQQAIEHVYGNKLAM